MKRCPTDFNLSTGRPKFLQMCAYCDQKKGWKNWTELGFQYIDCALKFVMENPDKFPDYHKKLAKRAKVRARRKLLQKEKQNLS